MVCVGRGVCVVLVDWRRRRNGRGAWCVLGAVQYARYTRYTPLRLNRRAEDSVHKPVCCPAKQQEKIGRFRPLYVPMVVLYVYMAAYTAPTSQSEEYDSPPSTSANPSPPLHRTASFEPELCMYRIALRRRCRRGCRRRCRDNAGTTPAQAYMYMCSNGRQAGTNWDGVQTMYVDKQTAGGAATTCPCTYTASVQASNSADGTRIP